MIKPKVLDLLNTRTVPSFEPVAYNDRERLLFDPYLHEWYILYLLVLFLLVHLSGLCELHFTGTIASLLTNCIYVMDSVHTAKVMIAEVLLQLVLLMLRIIWIVFSLVCSVMLAKCNIEQYNLPQLIIS